MEKPIKIAMLGSGTVGTGVIKVLQENAREIAKRIGAPLELKKVLVRDLDRKRPQLEGLALTDRIEDI
ncbi:MAG: homoserine dehydrogenase, partial [Selenomonadaceae bacterium]|nr:homoserine dehydrogenase [Selenomonadaceae bacterium]